METGTCKGSRVVLCVKNFSSMKSDGTKLSADVMFLVSVTNLLYCANSKRSVCSPFFCLLFQLTPTVIEVDSERSRFEKV